MNFRSYIVKIERTLKLWRVSNLMIQGKILVVRSLAVSKIVHLSLITMVPQGVYQSF